MLVQQALYQQIELPSPYFCFLMTIWVIFISLIQSILHTIIHPLQTLLFLLLPCTKSSYIFHSLQNGVHNPEPEPQRPSQ